MMWLAYYLLAGIIAVAAMANFAFKCPVMECDHE